MNKKISIQRRWALAWFKEWIKSGSFDSIFVQDKNNEYLFYFSGVTHQVEIWIRWGDITVAAMNRKSCWDMLRCIDLYPAKNSKGYYCSECIDKPVKYYSLLKDLYIHHSCNELLQWYREIIIHGNNLYLMKLPDRGSTWAEVTSDNRLKDDRKYIFKAISLFADK